MVYSKIEPFALIIFGGSGDLSYQKIYPALYDIAQKGHFPQDYAIIATGRKYTQKEFYEFFEHSLTSDNRHHEHSVQDAVFKSLEKHIYFYQGDNADSNFYEGLSKYLDKLNKEGLPCGNRLFYAGVPQSLYQTVFTNIKKAGLDKNPCGWTRIVIEKPIGEDEISAKKLDKIITSVFAQDQIFRLDHYLGKETLENVSVFRFKNNIFEPMLNSRNLDHIQITSSEDFGILKRGKFYDATGALKDVGQNHILQMLAVAAMEKPKDESDEAIVGERLKLVKSLKANPKDVVYGQYIVGVVHGRDAIAYRDEASIPKDSDTDTFFAMKLNIRNNRFNNVPVYIRVGKQMAMWLTEISYVFKGKDPYQNVLTIRVQPNAGISVKLFTKKPGLEIKVEPTYMQFCYKHHFSGETFDAYEKLLQDVFAGKHTFFNTSEEVEAQWRFIDPLSENRTPTRFYKAGSWGPQEADQLIEKDNRKWLEPYSAFCKI